MHARRARSPQGLQTLDLLERQTSTPLKKKGSVPEFRKLQPPQSRNRAASEPETTFDMCCALRVLRPFRKGATDTSLLRARPIFRWLDGRAPAPSDAKGDGADPRVCCTRESQRPCHPVANSFELPPPRCFRARPIPFPRPHPVPSPRRRRLRSRSIWK